MIERADAVANRLAARLALLATDPAVFDPQDSQKPDPLIVIPYPDLKPDAALSESGSASVDLRLGTWFVTLRQARMESLGIDPGQSERRWEESKDETEQPEHQPEQLSGETQVSEGDIRDLKDTTESPEPPREEPEDKSESARRVQFTETRYVPFGSNYILHPRSFVLGVTLEWIRLPHDLAGYVIGKSSLGRRGLIIATATGVHPGFTGCLTLELTNVGEIPIRIQPGLRVCQLFLHEVKGTGVRRVDHSMFACQRQPGVGQVRRDDMARKLARRR